MIELPKGHILGPYETRDEWLQARRLGLGGSDVGAVLGMSTYTSALEVYYSKTGEIEEEQEPTEAMEIGRDIEGWILEQWEKREGLYAFNQLVIVQSQTFPFLIHSPDALLLDAVGDGSTEHYRAYAGLEIKNVRSDAGWDPIPEFYYAQVQHGLLCSGLDRWIVVALVAGQRLITREIEPDKEMQGRIALESERFWVDHVLKKVPPEPDGSQSASRALRGRWGTSQDTVAHVSDGEWSKLKESVEMVKMWETERDKAIQIIQAKMGDAEVAKTVDGEKVATWRTSTRTTIDTKRLKSEAPELAKKYERVTPTRTFRPNL